MDDALDHAVWDACMCTYIIRVDEHVSRHAVSPT